MVLREGTHLEAIVDTLIDQETKGWKIQDQSNNSLGESSSITDQKKMWKMLWEMQHLTSDMDFLDVITFVLDRGTNSDFTMSSSTQIAKRMCYWEPPPRGFLKLNVDGAMFLNLRKAGVGVVVRDNKGKLVMAASKMGNEVDDPTTIELMALLRGLQLCVHLGFSKIVVESDCMLMVQELKDDQDSFSTNVNLIKEAKSLLQHFQEVEIQHVHCMGNEVAHRLACYSWNVDNISMW
ncbi:uncharacterized protein LOC108983774 [Juglans regia]|uniref:Uncharacterized protein LOC108983774 n=1 Tax=Juglans regia TaxID=51240 RepID=A0A6P9EBW9_JUGRE|nr:uncharacterized protein LOC108983774 [Juglans regia]